MEAITTEEGFLKFFEFAKEKAVELFHQDKHHGHLLFLVKKDGNVDILHFDIEMEMLGKALRTKDVGLLKDMVWAMIAKAAGPMGVIGMVEVFECWSIQYSEPENVKQARENFGKLVQQHGKNLGDVPGRKENLMVLGAFQSGVKKAFSWEIRRLTDDVVGLGDPVECNGMLGGEMRSHELFKVIMGEEKANEGLKGKKKDE